MNILRIFSHHNYSFTSDNHLLLFTSSKRLGEEGVDEMKRHVSLWTEPIKQAHIDEHD